MSLENLLPLGTMRPVQLSGTPLNLHRTHRQVRWFADMGHHEWRER